MCPEGFNRFASASSLAHQGRSASHRSGDSASISRPWWVARTARLAHHLVLQSGRLADKTAEQHRLRGDSLVPEAGREVALSQVVEQGHEPSGSLATGDTFDAHHVGTGGLADKKARAG